MHISDHASISKETNQAVLDRVSDAVFAVDEEWQYTYLNEAAADMVDRDPEEMLGISIWEACPELVGTSFETAIRKGATTQEATHVEEFLPEHGRWYDVQIYPDDTGVSLHVQDITDGKAKARRRRSFRQAVEEAAHAIYITDADGTIVYANSSAEAITGYSASELIGQTPQILSSGEHSEAFYEELWETVLACGSWQGELTNERKNGERYVVDQTITPLCDDDGPVRFVAVNREITDRRLREQRLAVLSRILRHNLRNSATIIQGYADNTESAGDAAMAVRSEAQALINLATRARQFDQLLADADNRQPVAIDSVVEGALVNDRWVDTDPTFEVDIAIGETVQTDPDLLQVIIEELIDNAVEHTKAEQPTVSIKARRIGSHHFELLVCDDGPGIPESELAPLKKGTETALIHGSGLGLWLVTWGVRHLGGTVSYETANNGGAVARITLPIGASASA